jgi:hypothetical protein
MKFKIKNISYRDTMSRFICHSVHTLQSMRNGV